MSIRALRTALGDITQFDLAAQIGVKPTSVYRYEAGLSIPDWEHLGTLAKLAFDSGHLSLCQAFLAPISRRLGVSTDSLLDGIRRAA